MLLYRVIWGHDFGDNQFCAPRIPEGMLDEDETIPRVCTATSIEGCLTSIGVPYIGTKALNVAYKNYCSEYPEKEIDMEKIWLSTKYPMTLMAFWIFPDDDPKVMTSKQIAHVVPDAEITGECWIMKRIKPTSINRVWLYDAQIKDVAVTLSNGERIRMFEVSNPIFSSVECQASPKLIIEINNAFVKANAQLEKEGFYDK